MEDEDLVDAIEELGQEPRLQGFVDRVANLLLAAALLGDLLDELAADVRRHDDDRVREIDGVALAVAQAAVVEHLQEDVEDVAMGLLDLVQEDHGVGPAADGLGQHAALLVADVARRGPDQPADRVPLHELAHVEADHGVFVVEHHLRQGLAQLGLAHAGRARGR